MGVRKTGLQSHFVLFGKLFCLHLSLLNCTSGRDYIPQCSTANSAELGLGHMGSAQETLGLTMEQNNHLIAIMLSKSKTQGSKIVLFFENTASSCVWDLKEEKP